MQGYNQWTGLGNVGKDPELREANGSYVLKIRLACTTVRFYDGKEHEKTEWVSVSLWGARAKGIAPHIKKGTRILVSGPLETRTYEKDGEKRYITEVKAEKIVFAGSAVRENTSYKTPEIEDPPGEFGFGVPDADDIPF